MKSVKPTPGQRRHIADDWGVWLDISADGICESVKVRPSPSFSELTSCTHGLTVMSRAWTLLSHACTCISNVPLCR